MTAPLRDALLLGDDRWLVERGSSEAIDGLLSIRATSFSTACRGGAFFDFVVVDGLLFLETIHLYGAGSHATFQAGARAVSRDGSPFAVPPLRPADERHVELPAPVLEHEEGFGHDSETGPTIVRTPMTRYRHLRLPITTTGTWVVGKRHDGDDVRRQALNLRERRTLRFVAGRLQNDPKATT